MRPGQKEQIREKRISLKEAKAMGIAILTPSDENALRLEAIISDRG